MKWSVSWHCERLVMKENTNKWCRHHQWVCGKSFDMLHVEKRLSDGEARRSQVPQSAGSHAQNNQFFGIVTDMQWKKTWTNDAGVISKSVASLLTCCMWRKGLVMVKWDGHKCLKTLARTHEMISFWELWKTCDERKRKQTMQVSSVSLWQVFWCVVCGEKA